MNQSVLDDVMDQIEHSDMVRALVKDPLDLADEMTAAKLNAIHMVMGISGESGELLDAIKKSVIYNKELDLETVIEELGDIEFYLEGLRQELGVTREQTLQANIEKLSVRYEGLSYSDSAAQTRADKA